MKRFIVPVDGSQYSNLAIEKARDLARAMGSHITLVNVYEPRTLSFSEYGQAYAYSIPDLKEQREQAEKLLADAKESLSEFGDAVETVLLEGDPAEAIIKYVEASEVDMVIMGSHGLKGIKRFLIGSVTSKVLHHIDKPILIVR